MTQLDVLYRYLTPPTESAALALNRVREVYGIRRLTLSQPDRTIRVEYDSTRLTEPTIHQLLRRSGLDITERLTLLPPQPEPTPTPTSPTP